MRITAYLQKSGDSTTFQLKISNQQKNVNEAKGILIPLLRKYVLRCTQLMSTSLITIQQQDETLHYSSIKEALIGFVKEGETGLLFIKIETAAITFSKEQIKEFEREDKYPLLYTFDFASFELENQPVDVNGVEQLVGKTLEFDGGHNAILYIRHHLEVRDNKIVVERIGEDYILTWTGITDDINQYDDRARPNAIYIKTPVQLKIYDSVDQYYELEYRSKV